MDVRELRKEVYRKLSNLKPSSVDVYKELIEIIKKYKSNLTKNRKGYWLDVATLETSCLEELNEYLIKIEST